MSNRLAPMSDIPAAALGEMVVGEGDAMFVCGGTCQGSSEVSSVSR